ncbi:hypothetical protein [Synechococcus sp. M16CYN]|uniref:hypothetical protein n=1 Tax=Synechococcus sp. M16CYN TaxID=3103139 RepID=UPI003244A252
MQEYVAFGGPLADLSMWRGALLWALVFYIPLSKPLVAFEASLTDSPLSKQWRQIILVLSSLLLASAVGIITRLAMSWVLGPGWASSLGLIAIGWSLLLIATSQSE